MKPCSHDLVYFDQAYLDGVCVYCLQQELDRTKAETKEQREVIKRFYEAAEGLSFGTDWNNGTHAKLHGYRQKLLDALKYAKKYLRDGWVK